MIWSLSHQNQQQSAQMSFGLSPNSMKNKEAVMTRQDMCISAGGGLWWSY